MANLFDYLQWRGDIDVRAVPFGEADYAILAALAYCPFEAIEHAQVTGKTLGELSRTCAPGTPETGTSDWHKAVGELWRGVHAYPRFADLTVARFVNSFEDNEVDELDKQFSAVTFALGSSAWVAFRGTDSTMVGWREDFNLGYETSVPSQREALAYVSELPERFSQVALCGHSKGGNLALYSAAKADAKVRARITEAWNFDGPGLADGLLASAEWKDVQERTHTVVPESSIIGMLFGQGVERRVVRSDGASFAQHNMFLWEVLGARFVTADRMTDSSEYFSRTLDEWIRDTTDNERKDFVGALFKLVNASGAVRTSDMASMMMKNLPQVFAAGNQYTEEEKAALKSFVGYLGKNGADALTSALGERLGPLMAGLGMQMPANLGK